MFIKKINYLLVFLLILLTARTVDAGLGISPSRLTNDHLLRDSVYEKTFTLSSSEPKDSLDFRVVIEGQIKDWVTTDKGEEFFWPAGQQRFPVTVIAKAPNDIPNGSYKGTIRFISSPKSQEQTKGSSTMVALAAAIQVNLTISGEQVLEYEIAAVNIDVVEQGLPMKIRLVLDNAGNVKARPTKVHVDIYDKFQEMLLASYDVTEMGFIQPFKREEIIIEIPDELDIGQYWAVVSIYRDDLLLEEEAVVFEKVERIEKNSGNANSNVFTANLGAITSVPVMVVIGLLILIIMILAIAVLKKKRNEK